MWLLRLKEKDMTTPNGLRSRLCMKERLINWSNGCIVCRDKRWAISKRNHKDKDSIDKVNNNNKSSSSNSRSHCYRVLTMSYSNGKIINYYKSISSSIAVLVMLMVDRIINVWVGVNKVWCQ